MTKLETGTFDLQGDRYGIDKYAPAGGTGRPRVVVIVHGPMA